MVVTLWHASPLSDTPSSERAVPFLAQGLPRLPTGSLSLFSFSRGLIFLLLTMAPPCVDCPVTAACAWLTDTLHLFLMALVLSPALPFGSLWVGISPCSAESGSLSFTSPATMSFQGSCADPLASLFYFFFVCGLEALRPIESNSFSRLRPLLPAMRRFLFSFSFVS